MLELKSGFLLAIEGIDGAGKSTLATYLSDQLMKENCEVVLTKEPGGTMLGRYLRTITQEQPMPLAPQAEFLLFAADRAQHMAQVVRPALAAKKIVISDRMTDSSVVYQGYGRGVALDFIALINNWIMSNTKIDLTFYLKISAQEAQKRIKTRGAKITVFEKDKEFVNRIVSGFEEHMANRDDVITLDASLSPHDICIKALEALKIWIQIHHNSI